MQHDRPPSRTPEYSVWSGMKQRCYNQKSRIWKYYGGRGIKVCARWRDSFAKFLQDMGPRPSPKHSIERLNNNGNYTPKNCIWAVATTQARNRRKPETYTVKPRPHWHRVTPEDIEAMNRRYGY
jgi:hypothetical protein